MPDLYDDSDNNSGDDAALGEKDVLLDACFSAGQYDAHRRLVEAETAHLQAQVQEAQRAVSQQEHSLEQLIKDKQAAEQGANALQVKSQALYERLYLHACVFATHQRTFQAEFRAEETPTVTDHHGTGTADDDAMPPCHHHNDNGNHNEPGKAPTPTPTTTTLPPMPAVQKRQQVLAQQWQSLGGQVEHLQEEFQETREKAVPLRQARHEASRRLQDLQASLAQLQDERAQAETEAAQHDTVAAAYRAQIKTGQEAVARLVEQTQAQNDLRHANEQRFVTEKAQRQADIEKLQADHARLSEALQAKTTEFQDLDEKKAALDAEYAEFSEWQAAYDAQTTQTQKEHRDYKLLYARVEQMNQEKLHLEERRERLEGELEDLQTKASEQEGNLTKAQARIQATLGEIELAHKQVKELQDVLAQDDEADSDLADTIQKEEKVQKLRDELALVENEEAELANIVDENQRRRAHESQVHEEAYTELQAKEMDLSRQVAELRAKLEAKKLARDETTAALCRRSEVLLYAKAAIQKSKKREQAYVHGKEVHSDMHDLD